MDENKDAGPPSSAGGDEGGGSNTMAVVLPFATAIAALALGAVLGAVIGWVAKPVDKEEVKVPRELTADEMAAACAPQVETKVNELAEAQNKIAFLEKEVADREARVKELEGGKAAPPAAGAGGGALAQARKDLEEARAQLEIARQEKEQLVAELTETKEKLVQTEVALGEQTKQTERAKEDALVNKWYRFVNEAQLEVCEKGSRKKLDECRQVVSAALQTNARRDKFAHCVRSGQAAPQVRELGKDDTLPSFTEMVGPDLKETKDWFVLFCDPTLPERADGFLNETPLPATTTAIAN